MELEAKNVELETSTYSVSHDLKAPLRGIDGYSRLLLADHALKLDEESCFFVQSIRSGTEQMRSANRRFAGVFSIRPTKCGDRGSEFTLAY